jgi:hypothetical protein
MTNSIEQHLKDILVEKGIELSLISDYLEDIFAFSGFESYEGISDKETHDDFKQWQLHAR